MNQFTDSVDKRMKVSGMDPRSVLLRTHVPVLTAPDANMTRNGLGAGMDNGIAVADEPDVLLVDRRTKVWLECNGEPRDVRSVHLTGIRTIAGAVEWVVFTCPLCGKRHQSLRFV